MFKVFGCPTYYHVDKGNSKPKSKKELFVSYKSGMKGFKLWSLFERCVIMSRYTVFDKIFMLYMKFEEAQGEKVW